MQEEYVLDTTKLAALACGIAVGGLGIGLVWGVLSGNSIVLSTETSSPYEAPGYQQVQSSEAQVGATIKATEHRYYPNSVAIQKGEAVEFINKGKQAVWPKSDSFDVGAPLQPGDSWSIQLGQVGTVQFYDFIYPHIKGQVVVEE